MVRPLSPEWRADAGTLAASLQMMRGLQVERDELANRFWLPFLAIYGVTLLVAFAAAAWLGRGITNPILRLADATRAVSHGRWDVRVDARGSDEVGQLGVAFNRMVETLDAQSRQLVELEKMAGWREMARALAHEVKNPLTPIRLTVEEMGSRYRGDDPDYRRLLDECTRIVVREVESLRNIVTRFREFSRPVELVWETVPLNDIVTEVGSLQRDMEVTYDLDPNASPLIGDPDRTRQVLMNLARNAQEAMRGQARARLHLTTRRDGDTVVLNVEDNGPGIPLPERSRVFEPYRSGKADGLGLGLTLVKGVVLAHGGTIEVADSTLGGARFRIVLPLRGGEQSSRGVGGAGKAAGESA
ncbi:MAG: ATP-binding protein [Candidatus Eisenbacteria bacterium]